MATLDDNKTIEFNYGKSIFPILSSEFDEKGEAHNLRFLGTGFFSIVEGWPVIFSAKHVIGGFEGKKAEPCLATRYGAKPALRLRGGMAEHDKLDIAFFVLEPEYYRKYQDEFRPIRIVQETLSLGMDVYTIGFPNSLIIHDEVLNRPIVEVDQYFYKGYVSNIIDTTDRGGTKKSYLVNFPAMSGISGAPLLITRQGEVVCVGFMFQEKSFSQKVDEKVLVLGGNKVTIPIYQTYNFGVACDSEPLMEVQKLLAGAPKGPKS